MFGRNQESDNNLIDEFRQTARRARILGESLTVSSLIGANVVLRYIEPITGKEGRTALEWAALPLAAGATALTLFARSNRYDAVAKAGQAEIDRKNYPDDMDPVTYRLLQEHYAAVDSGKLDRK